MWQYLIFKILIELEIVMTKNPLISVEHHLVQHAQFFRHRLIHYQDVASSMLTTFMFVIAVFQPHQQNSK